MTDSTFACNAKLRRLFVRLKNVSTEKNNGSSKRYSLMFCRVSHFRRDYGIAFA